MNAIGERVDWLLIWVLFIWVSFPVCSSHEQIVHTFSLILMYQMLALLSIINIKIFHIST